MSRATSQDVVVGAGDKNVVARVASQPVAFLVAGGIGASMGDGDSRVDPGVAVDAVIFAITGEDVGTGAALDEIGAVFAKDEVASGTGFDPVVASTAGDVVIKLARNHVLVGRSADEDVFVGAGPCRPVGLARRARPECRPGYHWYRRA